MMLMSTLPHHVLSDPPLAAPSNILRIDGIAEDQASDAASEMRPACPLRLKIGLAVALVVTGAWCLFLGWHLLSFCGRILS